MAADAELSGWPPGLEIAPHDGVAVAFDPALAPRAAAQLAAETAQRLEAAGVPARQRTWIVGAGADDVAAALLLAAIEPFARGSRLALHDPQDADGLIFERRLPGQRRGGIFLNADWQRASVRIACGDGARVLAGLAAWFTPAEMLNPETDLRADAVLRHSRATR